MPLYLGIKGVIAKSFARIHRDNLINSGILPLVFKSENDCDKISAGDKLVIENARGQIESGETIVVENKTKGNTFECTVALTPRLKEIILAGGVLALARSKA